MHNMSIHDDTLELVELNPFEFRFYAKLRFTFMSKRIVEPEYMLLLQCLHNKLERYLGLYSAKVCTPYQ